MIFLSTVLACLLIGSGISAVFLGSGMIVLERGWSMVISGSVVATGGVLLLGVAMLIRELRRLPDRLADVLPEALPHQLYYSADEFAGHPQEPAEAPAARRPRIDPPAALPRDVPVHPDAEAAEAPDRPAADETADAPNASALKIQISVHGRPGDTEWDDLPRTTDRPAGNGILPSLDNTDRARGADAAKTGRSLWSRLGRGEKPGRDRKVEPEADEPAEPPPGPTAAELARVRLALADTPDEDAAPADAVPAPAAEAGTPAVTVEPDDAELPETKPAEKEPAKTPAAEAALDGTKAADALPAADKTAPPPPEAAPADAGKDTAATDDGETEAAPAIVGSYRAGKNLYVMFEDGTIEAETPQGIFRFSSLDKLKAYIASGEDPALAGTPVDRPATNAGDDADPAGKEQAGA